MLEQDKRKMQETINNNNLKKKEHYATLGTISPKYQEGETLVQKFEEPSQIKPVEQVPIASRNIPQIDDNNTKSMKTWEKTAPQVEEHQNERVTVERIYEQEVGDQ